MPYEELSTAAQANVIADHAAKQEMKSLRKPIERYDTIGTPWPLQCNGKRIGGEVEKRLREEMQIHHTRCWWRNKLDLGMEEDISWDVTLPSIDTSVAQDMGNKVFCKPAPNKSKSGSSWSQRLAFLPVLWRT